MGEIISAIGTGLYYLCLVVIATIWYAIHLRGVYRHEAETRRAVKLPKLHRLVEVTVVGFVLALLVLFTVRAKTLMGRSVTGIFTVVAILGATFVCGHNRQRSSRRQIATYGPVMALAVVLATNLLEAFRPNLTNWQVLLLFVGTVALIVAFFAWFGTPQNPIEEVETTPPVRRQRHSDAEQEGWAEIAEKYRGFLYGKSLGTILSARSPERARDLYTQMKQAASQNDPNAKKAWRELQGQILDFCFREPAGADILKEGLLEKELEFPPLESLYLRVRRAEPDDDLDDLIPED